MSTAIQRRRIRKFVKALRSGKYQQAQGALSTANGFCCLGVACELYRKDKGLKSASIAALKWNDRHDSCLPTFVAEYYGFEHTNPRLPNGITAVGNNDQEKKTFPEIADLFEQKYLKG